HLLALTVTMADFEDALKSIEPSAAREVSVELGRTTWDNVGGLEQAKRTLVETIEWPLRYPELYAAMGLKHQALEWRSPTARFYSAAPLLCGG
ncbi:MAG: hypothetical protein ACHQPH_02275, partial [Reyranellales bacterium]